MHATLRFLALTMFVFAGCLSATGLARAQVAPGPAAPAAQQPAAPTDAAERARVVAELTEVLERRYVFPETGARYARALREALASGHYDGFADPAAFAERLTADLQATAPDRHLRVLTAGAGQPMRMRMGGGGTSAIEEARLLADGIAYLRFNLFPGDPRTAEAARAFLLANADVHTVILDSRPNRGGTLTVMDAILPLFYAQPTTLVRTDTRDAAAGGRPAPGPTRVAQPAPAGIARADHVVMPDDAETRLQDARLFYLTSSRTGSAAEHLALSLKRTGRATLVGETTGGAGHFGQPVDVGRFSVFVPFGRTYDPDTGKGWEGTGVTPDVAVPADAALARTLELAGLAADEAARIAASVEPAPAG